jgi:HSP20 family protein
LPSFLCSVGVSFTNPGTGVILQPFQLIQHLIGQEFSMNYIKINFGDQLDRFGAEIEKTIQDIFRPRPVNPMFACKDCSWVPQMDIYETKDEVFIWAELAGVEKQNLEVEINAKAVRIFGVRKEAPKEPSGTYRLAEIRYGKFERVLYLPSPVDTEVVSSAFVNGLLSIRVAKLEVHKTHKIPIEDE